MLIYCWVSVRHFICFVISSSMNINNNAIRYPHTDGKLQRNSKLIWIHIHHAETSLETISDFLTHSLFFDWSNMCLHVESTLHMKLKTVVPTYRGVKENHRISQCEWRGFRLHYILCVGISFTRGVTLAYDTRRIINKWIGFSCNYWILKI